MSDVYKLTYFPYMAIAEPIRWLLVYGNLEFEDIRITSEEWEVLKNDTPFGVVPTLEIKGNVKHQSLAICRYLGNIVGLSGDNAWENFEIDIVVDCIADLRTKIGKYNKMPNASSERAPLKEVLFDSTIPYTLSRLENMAVGGYLANGKLSWADIFFVALNEYNNGVLKQNIIDPTKYPNLGKIQKEVSAIPSIAAWIVNRPVSEY